MSAEILVLASRNEDKLAELREILSEVELHPLPAAVELPPEDGETFAENALTKARAARAATGRPAIADDSGIEASTLCGRPGVFSARFAGPAADADANLAKLMLELAPHDDRRVAYVCALAHIGLDGEERVFEGRCEGTLALERRGAGGFGYDPAFIQMRRARAMLAPWPSSSPRKSTRSAIAAARLERSQRSFGGRSQNEAVGSGRPGDQ